MGYQLTPFMPLYATLFVVLGSLTVYAAFRYVTYDRRLPVFAYATLMASLAVWELLNFVLEMVVSPDLKLIVHNMLNGIAVPFTLFSLLFFALAFSENERWIPWALLVFATNLTGVGLLLIIDPEFLYASQGLLARGPVTVLGVTFEEYVLHDRDLHRSFMIYSLFAYLVTLVSAGILVRYIFAKAEELHTEQSVLVGVGIGTPLALNGLLFFGALPQDLNLTDLGFGISAVCFALAVFRYRLFELPPIGRQQLVSEIDDPLVVVGDDTRIVYSNPAARHLFDVGSRWKGTSADAFFAPHADQLRSYSQEWNRTDTVELGDSDRYFDVNSTQIRTPAGRSGGRIIVFREVTELQRTNRRLDQFASMVSHDLRTPLSEATVRTNRLAREHPDERTEAVRTALDRMESIIDDMLTLARARADVERTEACSLGDLTGEVWESVRTDGVELDRRVGDATVDADPVRLFQVLENLLRNAVEHNDPPLTVRVGIIDGDPDSGDASAGFYIEDDGSGIPDADRDDIFDHGFTTDRDGNGYGLSIVQYIVDAHGWTIRVTEATDGGARFEITGVDAG